MTNKTIGVIGTRRRDTYEDLMLVYDVFKWYYNEGDSICSGLCPKGGDRFAVMIADRLYIDKNKRIWYPPNWKEYGNQAGFIRNTDIAKTSDILIACVAKNRKGGTEDTIRKFIRFHNKNNIIIV